MKKRNREDILHAMKNIAQKFKGVEMIHESQAKSYEAQARLIQSINEDFDRIFDVMKRNGKDKK